MRFSRSLLNKNWFPCRMSMFQRNDLTNNLKKLPPNENCVHVENGFCFLSNKKYHCLLYTEGHEAYSSKLYLRTASFWSFIESEIGVLSQKSASFFRRKDVLETKGHYDLNTEAELVGDIILELDLASVDKLGNIMFIRAYHLCK